MNIGKNYLLRLEINKITSHLNLQNIKFRIKIARQSDVKESVHELSFTDKGEMIVNETFQFTISNRQFKSQSKCVIMLQKEKEIKESNQQWGRLEFLIMDYRNYSKSMFKLISKQGQIVNIYLKMNIISSQTSQQKLKLIQYQKVKQKINKVEAVLPKIQIFQPCQNNINSGNSFEQSANKIFPQAKLITPSEVSQRQIQNLYPAYQHYGNLLKNKQQKEKKNHIQSKPLSSMGQILQHQTNDNFLKVPQNLINTCMNKNTPSKSNDSRFCKQIQENLDSLSLFDLQPSNLRITRSPLIIQSNQCTIFETWNRIKDKFERIHQKQYILNNSDPYLNILPQKREESQQLELSNTQNKQIQIESNLPKSQYISYNNELGRSAFVSLQLPGVSNLKLSHKTSSKKDRCKIVKTIDIKVASKQKNNKRQRKQLSVYRILNMKMLLNPNKQCLIDGESMILPPYPRKYRLTLNKPNLITEDPQVAQVTQVSQVPKIAEQALKQENDYLHSLLNDTYQQFDAEQQQLRKANYIKLNKISHLSKAADISKRRNNYLIKANEQLIISQKHIDKQLQVSKKIIHEKQDMLNHEFQNLKNHMKIINNNLALKNQESGKREEKIILLQGQVEHNTRQINQLKEELKSKNATIKQLKHFLILRQDYPIKMISQKQSNDLSSFNDHKNQKIIQKKGIATQIFAFPTQRQTGPNQVFKTYIDDDKRNTTVDNAPLNFTKFDEIEKSCDLTNGKYRRFFSHSKKNKSGSMEIKRQQKLPSQTDIIFQKLNCFLVSPQAEKRLLKNL